MIHLSTNRSGLPVLATLGCRPIGAGRIFSQLSVLKDMGGGGGGEYGGNLGKMNKAIKCVKKAKDWQF